jgi:hypothetical protein
MNTDAAADPGQGDQTHHFACMKLAAEAGIAPGSGTRAPKIGFRSPTSWRQDRFQQRRLLFGYPLAFRRCTLCRRPRSRESRITSTPWMDSFEISRLQRFCRRVKPGNSSKGTVASVYPRHDLDMVSSHHDLKPENLLFDGNHAWLVDWKALS